MKYILEQGNAFAFCLVAPILGAAMRLILYGYYVTMEKQYLGEKTPEELLEKEQSPKYFFYWKSLFGIGLETWERVTSRMLGIAAMTPIVLALMSYQIFESPKEVVRILVTGALLSFCMAILYTFFGVQEKKERIRSLLCEPKETAVTEQELKEKTANREERQETTRKELFLLTEPKRGSKEKKAEEEKRKLTEELFRERRASVQRPLGNEYFEGVKVTERQENTVDELMARLLDAKAGENKEERCEKILRNVLAELLSD